MTPQRETFSHFSFFHALDPVAAAATTNGKDVDLRGYDSCTFIVNLGRCSYASTASYWKLRIQHTDASALGLGPSDYADCTSVEVIRQASGAMTSGIFQSVGYTADIANSLAGSRTYFVGYRGGKRYVRLVAEMVSTPSVLNIAVTALRGHPANWPVNTPNLDD